jgi:RimJ/RimL family protein N-acetyltransferase
MESSAKNNHHSFRIEKAEAIDATAINEVSRQAWLATYPNDALSITTEDIRNRVEGSNGELIEHKIEQWRRIIESSGKTHEVFVARVDDEVVGFVSPRIVRNGERRIAAIYTSPESQGNGYGAALLLSALEWHGSESDIYLHAVAYNQQAIDFYERFGFVQTGQTVEDRLSKTRGLSELPLVEMILQLTDD